MYRPLKKVSGTPPCTAKQIWRHPDFAQGTMVPCGIFPPKRGLARLSCCAGNSDRASAHRLAAYTPSLPTMLVKRRFDASVVVVTVSRLGGKLFAIETAMEG